MSLNNLIYQRLKTAQGLKQNRLYHVFRVLMSNERLDKFGIRTKYTELETKPVSKQSSSRVFGFLIGINDDVSMTNIMSDDIDDQRVFTEEEIKTANNYGYDEIGNLKFDKVEGIDKIEWTAYGKVKSITRVDGYFKVVNNINVYPSNLEFLYDAMGNRIAKIEKPRDANGEKSSADWKTTYYIRDAQGNPMATYSRSSQNQEASYKLIERPIYGSSRVGIDNYSLEFIGYSTSTSRIYNHVLGLKQYELSNHLGNVLTTISDKKIPVENNGVIDYYVADITTASDFYPFGSPMDGRTFSSEKYRYGYGSHEKVDEISGSGNHYTAMFWEYDPRLGRRWNLDPVDQISISNYAVFRNNPIFWIDPLGSTVEPTTDKAKSETAKFGEKTTLNKKGKEIANKNYEPAFGEMYQKWKNDENIYVKFTTVDDSEDFGGTISYDGENEAGQKVYSVMWNPNLTEKLGASGIFEESFHLMEALGGTEMAFPDRPNSGVMGVDIYDEVRAKQWVGNNIKSMRSTYSLGGDYHGYTHYGYIKKLNDKEVIKGVLMNGLQELLPPINRSMPSSGSTLGGSRPGNYTPMGFGGKYSTFPDYDKKP